MKWTMSIPGYTQDELDISLLNNHLTLSGKQKIKETNTVEKKRGSKWLHQGIKKVSFL
ncbi:MAG: Hsp20 family protein [Arsenophonus sp. NC-WZS1-MAG3]